MSSIVFTDADGTWRLWNAKPMPGTRFRSWTPDSVPFGDSAVALANGAITMLRLRNDYGVSFEIPLIESVRGSNELVWAEALDNAAWVKAGSTVTPNFTYSPGGDITADKIEETSTPTISHSVVQSVAGLTNNAVYSFSTHLAASERSWALVQIVGKDAAAHFAFVNLATGEIGNTSGTLTKSVVFVWYGIPGFIRYVRVGIAANIASGGATPSVSIFPATGNGAAVYTGTAGSGIFAWGHQLDGGNVRPYVMTQGSSRLASAVEIADRLRYHLLNGGTCAVQPGDVAGSQYATCGLKPGTVPQLQLSDRRAMEFTLSLQLINLAGSPVRMMAHYAEQ